MTVPLLDERDNGLRSTTNTCLPILTNASHLSPSSSGTSITSEAKIVSDRALQTKVEIHLAAGEKCSRCWKVLPEVKVNHGLCNRCEEVVLEKV